jgi:archaellum component FlaC
MANELSKVEREEIARRLAGRPVTYIAPAAVLVLSAFGGFLFVGIVLAFVAFLVSMGVQFDRATKKRTGGAQPRSRRNQPQYAPEIQSEIDKAHATQRAIDEAIANADHPFEEIQEDVKMIVSAMETSAKRAQMIHDTLHDQSQSGHDERAIVAQIEKLKPRFGEKDVRELINDLEAQRESNVKLRESLERFKINMARLNASLGLMRTRLIEMSAAEEATLQRELAEQAREIRDRTERFTRVLLETSDEAGGDELQRELDRDAAAKGQSAAIPLRNRATPPPEPARAAPTPPPADSGPREIPMRNRAQPAPEPAAPSPPREVPMRNRAQPTPPTPKPAPADEGPRQIPLTNRAKPSPKRDADPQNPPPIDTRKKR